MNGQIDQQGRALLLIAVRATEDTMPEQFQVWVETGFTGDLVLPQAVIEHLGLKPVVVVRGILADGRDTRLRSYVAGVDWFEELLEIEVVAGSERTHLLGVGMLLGHRLIVDYQEMKLSLT